jgi:hypothetical protein
MEFITGGFIRKMPAVIKSGESVHLRGFSFPKLRRFFENDIPNGIGTADGENTGAIHSVN